MIFIDYRRGSHELVKPLMSRGLDVEETTLSAGDIAFVGRGEAGREVNIGIEFKKVGELIGSIRTGRLQGKQLLGMRDEFDFSYLLVEGEVLFDRNGRMCRRAGRGRMKPLGSTVAEYMKRLFVLHLCGGMNYLRSEKREETLQLIEHLYHTWTDKNLDEHDSHIAIYQPASIVPISEWRQMVAPLDGIGLKTSSALEVLCHGSMDRFLRLTVAELTEVTTVDTNGKERRLGESTARKIYEAIQRIR